MVRVWVVPYDPAHGEGILNRAKKVYMTQLAPLLALKSAGKLEVGTLEACVELPESQPLAPAELRDGDSVITETEED